MRGSVFISSSSRDALYKGFAEAFEARFIPQRKKPFFEWVSTSRIVLDGKPLSFARHEYLELPYSDDHPEQVEMKAAQMGLTSKAALRSIHGAVTSRYPRGVLYLFPSRTDVTDFSKGRISPLVQESPDSVGKWIVDNDTANLKQIGTSFLYLRGMKSRVGLKSAPVDFIVFDELDEAAQPAIDMALERMSHSEIREV